jgi:(R,R)-butanediol dehydrogenase / meso-butanediol dehydrogenase / diacetyl reductase
MKAGVYSQVGVITAQDVPEPRTGPDEIKVKIAYCGICGTDPESVAGHFPPIQPPRIMGHEASGTIVEIGSACKQGYQVGQRVAMNFWSPCGVCYYCRNKVEHFCLHRNSATGSFAEYAVYKENAVYLLPDNVSLEIGALLEPVTIAVHTMDLANIAPGKSVCVIGAGPIGLLSMELALKAGAAKLMVSEPVAEKRALAKKLGADVAVDPLNESLENAAKKLTDGRGFDTVIEASGKLGPARQAINLADKCGTIVWAAVYPADAEISVNPFYMYSNELTIRSVRVAPYSFPRAVNLLAKLDLQPLITDIVFLQDIDKGFALHKNGKSIKILVKP